MGKFTSQGKSYGGVSFGAQMGNMFGSGLTEGMGKTDEERKQLMQNLGNNNRLSAAQPGEQGAFQYGGRWLKVVDKPQTGQDKYYEQRANNYVQEQIMGAYGDSLIKSYAAGLQPDQAQLIANNVLQNAANAFGWDASGMATMDLPKKEPPKPVGFFDFRRVSPKFAWTGEEPFDKNQKKVTMEDMKTKPQGPAVQTPQVTTKPITGQFDVEAAIKNITAKAPQPPGVNVGSIAQKVRDAYQRGVSKEVILRDLRSKVANAEAFFEEAIK